MAKINYLLIAKVRSFTSDKIYLIKKNPETGQLSCNCPAWIFQKGSERNPCKHIRSLVLA